VEGAEANEDETPVSLGEPAEDVRKESEEWAIGVEAKEISDEVPVEGPDAKENETPVALGKPKADVRKESEEGAIEGEAKKIVDEVPVEGPDAKEDETLVSLGEPKEDNEKDSEEGAIEGEAKEISEEVLAEGADAKEGETPVSLGEPKEDVRKESDEGAIELEAKEISDEVPVEGADAKEDATPVSLGEPVEELPEKIENLSINEDGFDRQHGHGNVAIHSDNENEVRDDSAEENDTVEMMTVGSSEEIEVSIAPGNETATKSERCVVPSSLPSNECMIERTRLFYDLHSREYTHHVLDLHSDALCPAPHRDAFVSHVCRQRSENGTRALGDHPITIIDLGCGCGRDARHFASLGHNVLGIDFSIEMLKRARDIAPRAHFLHIDVRDLKRALVDESVDGVWAHLSLMHLPRCDALDVLRALYVAARVGGVLFMSLEMGNDDDGSLVFEIDRRYTASKCVPPFPIAELAAVDADDDDSRRKLCSYFTIAQARELLTDSGWEVIDLGEDDRRGMSEYVTHSMLYVFASRRKE
jgi:SAM-dependent methyltransferase